MSMYYILVDGKEEPVGVGRWKKWFEENLKIRTVGNLLLVVDGEEVLVSTVFLGINHNFNYDSDSPPLIYETMIFGGRCNHETWRYSTMKEAQAGHKLAVEFAKSVENAI